MDEIFYKLTLAILIVSFFIIRAPSVRKASKTEKIKEAKPKRERFLVFLNFIGMMGIPFVYISAQYSRSHCAAERDFVRIFGIIFNIAGLILLVWVHKTLGQHWSMLLKLGQEHALVTTGPYSRVRHPMYTYFYIMVIATALISANLLVGVFGIGVWTILYVVRVGDEEKMLLNQFGDEYRVYMNRTGRLLPKFRR